MTPFSSTSPLPRFQSRLDRAIVDPAGGARFLIVDIEPPQEERVRVAPLDLVLVIDVSGSMSGAKLAAVKQAAALLTERLGADDRLSLVSFSSDVHMHFTAQSMAGAGGELARSEIRGLHTLANTNLSAGWLTGVALLEKPADPTRRRAVVVLSDGLANAGLVDPRELSEIARRSGAGGIPTTCIGVGNDYSTVQLGAIAECSGGRFHDAEEPAEILEVMLGELVELGSIALQNAALELELPEGFTALPLWTAVSERAGLRLHCPIGGLRGGTKRTLVLRVAAPARPSGTQVGIALHLCWTDPRSGARREISAEPVVLRYGDASLCRASDADVELVTRMQSASVGRRLADLNEAGRYDEIEQVLGMEVNELLSYAESVPAARGVACLVRSLVAEGTRPMDPRNRKNAHIAGYKAMKQEHELRHSRRNTPEGE
jgi:Ca-activated chloride channel family protein